MPIDQIAREIHGMYVEFTGYSICHTFRPMRSSDLRFADYSIFDPEDTEYTELRFTADGDGMGEETWDWTAHQWQSFFTHGKKDLDPDCDSRCLLQSLPVLDYQTLKALQD